MRGTSVTGVIIKPGTGKQFIIGQTLAKELKLVLSADTSWYMGIDQSTTCTGIALKAANKSFIILLDVMRDKNLPKDDYYADLRRLLARIARDRKFDIVINEKPIPSTDKRYASTVLLEFLGRLSVWLDSIMEFDDALRDGIYPQVWKSMIMNPAKGKNRSKFKSEVAEDIVDIYPELENYYLNWHTKDYDAFDALGILDGYIRYAFTPDGYPMIHGTKEKKHTSLVLYDWINWDDSKSYEDNICEALGDNLSVFEPYILRYNPKYSLHDNIRMATSNYECTATILPQEELNPFMWKYSVDIKEPGKQMLMIALKKGAYTLGFVNSATSVYDWNEEVFDE